jgi:hypothetical protein
MATSLRDTDSIVASLEAFLAVVVHMVGRGRGFTTAALGGPGAAAPLSCL